VASFTVNRRVGRDFQLLRCVRVDRELRNDHDIRMELRDGQHGTRSTPTTTHTYSGGGSYTATLTETDSGGTSTSDVFIRKNAKPKQQRDCADDAQRLSRTGVW